jgi:DNA mismatch repair protein MutS2
MDRQSLRVLEYPHILTVLEALAATEPGRRAVRELRPSTEREMIATWLGQVTELKDYLQSGNSLPLTGVEVVSLILDRVGTTGQVIGPENLLKVASTLEVTRLLHRLAGQLSRRCSRLAEILGRVQPVPELEAKIGRAIDGHGKIRDDASPALARLRAEIGRLRERLHSELTQILERQAAQKTLQEKLVTIRNGRLVIPVRSGARGAVEGIVHDTSQSGATSFVEPLAVVPLNNALSRTRSLEQEEEARILRELTEAVAEAAEVLRSNERWLGEIDCLHAKARLSVLLRAREPVLVDSGERIRLLQARHPILVLQVLAREGGGVPASLVEVLWGAAGAGDPKPGSLAVVPIDLHLTREENTLIISGANAGGKTVSLKTLGLLGAMAQTGLHIPVAEGSEWPVLTGVFAEIGDEQDLRSHLSTFSARIQRLVAVLNLADDRSLILLDELGTGTDPAEGAALALAVLDRLRNRGAFIAVTTHYHLIKAYGMVEKGVVNAAVDFDEASGRPVYRLRYGRPGTSNALKIAADLAMPHEVLEGTRRYLSRDEQRTGELIQQLEAARREAERAGEELGRRQRDLEAIHTDLVREREELARSQALVIAEARERAESLLAEAEKELKAAIARFQEQGSAGAPEARRRVEKMTTSLRSALQAQTPPGDGLLSSSAAGRLVRLRGTGGTGVILEVKDDGRRAEIQVGPKRVEMDARAIELLPVQESRGMSGAGGNGVRVFRDGAEGRQDRLNLVGLRVEDALPLLDKAIDRALLDGRSEIQVVHGHGTGRLRRAVQEFLLSHAGVRGFHHEVQNRGGSGVTVVELKD